MFQRIDIGITSVINLKPLSIFEPVFQIISHLNVHAWAPMLTVKILLCQRSEFRFCQSSDVVKFNCERYKVFLLFFWDTKIPITSYPKTEIRQ